MFHTVGLECWRLLMLLSVESLTSFIVVSLLLFCVWLFFCVGIDSFPCSFQTLFISLLILLWLSCHHKKWNKKAGWCGDTATGGRLTWWRRHIRMCWPLKPGETPNNITPTKDEWEATLTLPNDDAKTYTSTSPITFVSVRPDFHHQH